MPALSRRELVRRLAAVGLGVAAADLLAACAPAATAPEPPPSATAGMAPQATATASPAPAATATTAPTATATPVPAYLAVVRGPEPGLLAERAVAAVGGIERFVKPGANVIVKPNICIASTAPELAAATNPEIVATLVRLCLAAGARQVRVMDQPFAGTPDAAYVNSGIQQAVEAVGGKMEIMADMKYREVDIPQGKDLKRWRVYGEILDADLIINVPVAKTHGLSRLTLGGKNLMGVVMDRGEFRRNLGQRIADIVSLVRPALTVIDAVRIMVRNGPTGGSPDDLKVMNTVIASADIVAADSYATGLFGLKPANIGFIQAAADMGLGTMDLSSIKIEELEVS